ncbi:hypothetical protein [uncultured Gammaproteobacteria bacterium]|nr:hypothetical protein [uncultured Gammaproteobacteria bacterium]
MQVLAFAFFVVVSWLGFAYFLKTHSVMIQSTTANTFLIPMEKDIFLLQKIKKWMDI